MVEGVLNFDEIFYDGPNLAAPEDFEDYPNLGAPEEDAEDGWPLRGGWWARDGAPEQTREDAVSPASKDGGKNLQDGAPKQSTLLSSARLNMHRDNKGQLLEQFRMTFRAWVRGKPLEDPQRLPAFNGCPAQLQDCGYDPAENGAACVEVRGATAAVAASVMKTSNVRRMPPASPASHAGHSHVPGRCVFPPESAPHIPPSLPCPETRRPARSERHGASALSAFSTSKRPPPPASTNCFASGKRFANRMMQKGWTRSTTDSRRQTWTRSASG